jgi:O-antigen/teichoic acid export membrane protein
LKKALISNAAANVAGFIANIAAALILSPLLVHGLGDERYGIWVFVDSILAYFSVLELGIGPAIVRFVARFQQTKEQDELNRVVSTSFCAFSVIAFIILVSTVGLALFWGSLLPKSTALRAETQWLLIALGLNLAIGMPSRVFAAALHGLALYPILNLERLIILIMRTSLLTLVMLRDQGIPGLCAVTVGCTVVDFVLLAILAQHYLPDVRLSWRFIDRKTFVRIGSYSMHAFVLMLCQRVSFQTDAIVIGAFLAPSAIAYFAVAGNMVRYAKEGISAVTLAMAPTVSSLEARGADHAIKELLLGGCRVCVYLILPIQLGLIMLGQSFLRNWLGAKYATESFPTLWILAVPLAIVVSQDVPGRILYGLGRLRWFACLVVIEALGNLVMSVLLVGPLGIEGVALGTSIPSVIGSVALAWHVCKVTQVPFGTYLRQTFVRPLAAATAPAAVWAMCLSHFGNKMGWMEFFAVGFSGVLVYAAVVVMFEYGTLRRVVERAVNGKANVHSPASLRS